MSESGWEKSGGGKSVQVRSILGMEWGGEGGGRLGGGKSAGAKNEIFCVTVYEVGAVGVENRGRAVLDR